jgi:hypothetical protein
MRNIVRKPGKSRAKGYTIGRSAFARISAVEGIVLSDTMDEDFRDFDRKGLSASERRTVITRKYGKAR